MTHIIIFIHWFVLVFTFGNVEMVTIDNSKSNDFPIEELNNHTLREVFEDNNYKTNTLVGWNGIGFASVVGDSIYYNNTSLAFNGVYRDLTVSLNDDIYFRGIIFDGNDNVGFRINKSLNVFGIDYYNSTSQGEKITTFNALSTTVRVVLGADGGKYNYYKDIYLINRTDFGISHLTVDEMNDWFNVYQENAQREISETYDYIENELTVNDLIYIVLFALLWSLGFRIIKELI